MSETIYYRRGARVEVHGAPNDNDINGKTGTVHVVNQDNGRIGVCLDDDDLVIDLPPQHLLPLHSAACIRPETTLLPYLGGQVEINHVPMDTAYGRLPRAPSLPPLHSKDKEFNDNHAQNVFMKLFAGEFTAQWWQNGSEFIMWARNDCEADAINGRLLRWNLWRTPEGTVKAEFFMYNESFTHSLSMSQALALHLRVFHRLLRTYGCLLSESLVEMGCDNLYNSYAKNKWWKEQLDVCMIRGDIALNNNYDNIQIVVSLCHVAKSLECLGRFKQAAEIYNQTANNYSPVRSEAASAYYCSGLTYMKANDAEEAERAYVLALHFDSTSDSEWDLDSAQACNLFTGLWKVCLKLLESASITTASRTEGSIVTQLLIGLLYAHGFHGHGDFNDSIIQKNRSNSLPYTKERIQGKIGAKQALVRAASYPDVASFRSAIVSCKLPNYYNWDVPLYSATGEGQERRHRNEMRKAVYKETIQERHVSCENPTCAKLNTDDNADFKTCPCRAVSYCQKSCQVADWRRHKKVCVWKKNQKENGDAAKNEADQSRNECHGKNAAFIRI